MIGVVVAWYQLKGTQERMFKALGFSAEEANDQFGFLLEAMDYGLHHTVVYMGLTVLRNAARWRRISAKSLLKNNKATDPMTQAPSTALKQLEELNLQVEQDETNEN